MFEAICEALHHEMDTMGDKFDKGDAMSNADLDHIDKMAHALKCIATYETMKGAGEYEAPRGRRYTGRDWYGSQDGYRRY